MKIVSISGSSSNFEDNQGQKTSHVFFPLSASSRFSTLHSPKSMFFFFSCLAPLLFVSWIRRNCS